MAQPAALSDASTAAAAVRPAPPSREALLPDEVLALYAFTGATLAVVAVRHMTPLGGLPTWRNPAR